MTKEEKAIRDFCGHHADWWPSITQVQEMLALAQPEQEPTYTSTQATNCAGCGEHKHTPLRIDAMGGYVCLTCIDKKLGSLLGEFGYEQPEQEPVAWMTPDGEGFRIRFSPPVNDVPLGWDALYTTPPRKAGEK